MLVKGGTDVYRNHDIKGLCIDSPSINVGSFIINTIKWRDEIPIETIIVLSAGPLQWLPRGNNSKRIRYPAWPSRSYVTKHFQSLGSPFCNVPHHYNDVIMGAIASQITSLTIVYSTVYSGAYQRKHQSSASLDFVRANHRGPVNSPHKWPVTRQMFPFDDVIMPKYIFEKNGPKTVFVYNPFFLYIVANNDLHLGRWYKHQLDKSSIRHIFWYCIWSQLHLIELHSKQIHCWTRKYFSQQHLSTWSHSLNDIIQIVDSISQELAVLVSKRRSAATMPTRLPL